MSNVRFATKTKFTGRNGYFACSGLNLCTLEHNNSVMIAPLTGRGAIGRCDIQVPFEAIPALIQELKKIEIEFQARYQAKGA